VKFSCVFSLLALLVSNGIAAAQTAPDSLAGTAVVSATTQQPTSAQQRIEAAEKQVKAHPKDAQPYVELALAWIRRARETANPIYFNDAEQAITAGLAFAQNDFQLSKAHVALLLGRHEFAQARTEATVLNRRTPDDVTTYGYLAEADIALGEYQDAEEAAQWMLNLLPNNVPGLTLGAQLRDVYGDPEGALELLNQAYRETPSTENEELAWVANRMAEVEIGSGKLDQASQILESAERLMPAYPYTLENLARVKLEQHRYPDAIALLLEEQKVAPSDAEGLYLLAKAEELSGQASEAASRYAEFVTKAKALINEPANANRALIFYYADHAGDWPQALSVARREIGVRHDVWTLDAYAWALYGNGHYAEANAQIEKALAVGVRSAQVFDHAGNIALKLGKQAEASRYFEASLQVDPASEPAANARRELGAVAAPNTAPPSSDASGAAKASIVSEPSNTAKATSVDSVSSTSVTSNSAAIGATSTVDTLSTFRPVPAALLIPRPTGTARVIRTMQSQVERSPNDAKAYAGLGAAYFQMARETGDVENYQLAEQSLAKSLELVSTDMSAASPLAAMAEACMGEHRFQDALTYAERALSLGSGDLSPFAIEGDAYADMGEYEKAANAYGQLTPSGPATPRTTYVQNSRTSYLKFISGDTDGAVRLMQSAVAAGTEVRLPKENLAWLYFELGEYAFLNGDRTAADSAYLAALTIYPGDYRALAGLGKVRASEGRYTEAIALYKSAIAVVPMPIYVAELGDLYSRTGDREEAKKQYQLVEYIGLLGHINQVLHNRDLALFYADHDMKLAESLALARKEFEVRHDIYTWDALAWALYKNGKYQDAQDAMRHALHFGTKDSMLLFHAGMISSGLGDNVQAQQQLGEAIRINPHFHVLYADAARRQLALLQTRLQLTAKGGKNDVR
jgi:tetratricopeptide (TPR) repeat protein